MSGAATLGGESAREKRNYAPFESDLCGAIADPPARGERERER